MKIFYILLTLFILFGCGQSEEEIKRERINLEQNCIRLNSELFYADALASAEQSYRYSRELEQASQQFLRDLGQPVPISSLDPPLTTASNERSAKIPYFRIKCEEDPTYIWQN